MQIISGIIEQGKIKTEQPLPAEDGTSVMVFIIPKRLNSFSTENIFGKWNWCDEKIQGEISNE